MKISNLWRFHKPYKIRLYFLKLTNFKFLLLYQKIYCFSFDSSIFGYVTNKVNKTKFSKKT